MASTWLLRRILQVDAGYDIAHIVTMGRTFAAEVA